MTGATTLEQWQTSRVALKWNCRTQHDRWKLVGGAILVRGTEQSLDLSAGQVIIEGHKNRDHRTAMKACLSEDPIRFWDLVYKYWRPRGPHDGLSRETINLDSLKGELE